MLNATFEEKGGVLLVTPLVDLDAEAAPAFRDVVGERARGRDRVVLSLAHVAIVDCSGLAGLVSVLKRMAPGGELRLAEASRSVRALLAATQLDAVFPVYEDAEAALSS
jgi:anti-sigma B factor antagonist